MAPRLRSAHTAAVEDSGAEETPVPHGYCTENGDTDDDDSMRGSSGSGFKNSDDIHDEQSVYHDLERCMDDECQTDTPVSAPDQDEDPSSLFTEDLPRSHLQTSLSAEDEDTVPQGDTTASHIQVDDPGCQICRICQVKKPASEFDFSDPKFRNLHHTCGECWRQRARQSIDEKDLRPSESLGCGHLDVFLRSRGTHGAGRRQSQLRHYLGENESKHTRKASTDGRSSHFSDTGRETSSDNSSGDSSVSHLRREESPSATRRLDEDPRNPGALHKICRPHR